MVQCIVPRLRTSFAWTKCNRGRERGEGAPRVSERRVCPTHLRKSLHSQKKKTTLVIRLSGSSSVANFISLRRRRDRFPSSGSSFKCITGSFWELSHKRHKQNMSNNGTIIGSTCILPIPGPLICITLSWRSDWINGC